MPTRIHVNPTLERLRSVTDAARLETKIGSAFGLPSDVYVVIAEGPQLEPLLQTNERLAERLAAVPGLAFQPPTRLLPSAAAQARTIAQIGRAQLSPATVRAAVEQARVASGFTPGAFDPFSARVPRLLDPAERLSYDGYVAHGLNDLIDRFVVHDGDRWTLATYVFPANADQSSRLQTIVDAVDPAQTLTGLTVVNQELARSFLPQFIKGLAIGTLIVIALVVAAFRQWRLSMYALLPTAVGLVWTAGALAAAGVELDLFAVFAVVTFVGIGVDYGVHLVHRYQERGDASRATAELAPVILVAAAITLLGYGTLITSSYPPLRSIGVVSAVSVVALAVASVLLLPALLLTPSRRPLRSAPSERRRSSPPSTRRARSPRSSRASAARSRTSSSWTTGRPTARRNARGRRGRRSSRTSRTAERGTRSGPGLARVLAGDFTHVLLLDGDMQHLPEEAAALLAAAADTGADVVLGERRFDRSRMPASRYHANRIGSRVLSWFVGVPVQDTQCGFRVFRVEALRPLRLSASGLRNRNRDAREGAAARRARGGRADHGRVRRPAQQAAAGPRHDAHLFPGGVLSIP